MLLWVALIGFRGLFKKKKRRRGHAYEREELEECGGCGYDSNPLPSHMKFSKNNWLFKIYIRSLLVFLRRVCEGQMNNGFKWNFQTVQISANMKGIKIIEVFFNITFLHEISLMGVQCNSLTLGRGGACN